MKKKEVRHISLCIPVLHFTVKQHRAFQRFCYNHKVYWGDGSGVVYYLPRSGIATYNLNYARTNNSELELFCGTTSIKYEGQPYEKVIRVPRRRSYKHILKCARKLILLQRLAKI